MCMKLLLVLLPFVAVVVAVVMCAVCHLQLWTHCVWFLTPNRIDVCNQLFMYVCSRAVGQYLWGLRNRGCSTNWATKTTATAIIINKLNATIKQFRTARGNWKVINANNYAKWKWPKEIPLCVNQLWTTVYIVLYTVLCVVWRLSGEYWISFSLQL